VKCGEFDNEIIVMHETNLASSHIQNVYYAQTVLVVTSKDFTSILGESCQQKKLI
jgi:hypothetical protein